MPYVTVRPTDSPRLVSLPAPFIAGQGFAWTPQGWATTLPLAALVQAPGAFLVKA